MWLGRNVRKPLSVAFGLGVSRLVLGWVTGVAVAPFVVVAAGLVHLPVFYFTGLALVRWLEWGVIHCFIPGAGSVNSDLIFSGNSGRSDLTSSGARLAAGNSEGKDDRHAEASRDPGTATRRPRAGRSGQAGRSVGRKHPPRRG